jgi:hypothetical protein
MSEEEAKMVKRANNQANKKEAKRQTENIFIFL